MKEELPRKEYIRCPRCHQGQLASVGLTCDGESFTHECNCGYLIEEHEWDPIIREED
jgi:hypothetical protein